MKIKLTVKTMTYMAMFAALHLVLEFLTRFTPQMPQGGSVAFSFIAIILCGYLMGAGYGLIVGIVCTGLQFATGLAVFYGPLSVIFDYLIPLCIMGVAVIIPDVKNFPLGIIVMGIIKTISHLLAGYFAFHTPLPGNLAYNLPYNIATIVTCVILHMILYPRLKRVVKVD